MKCSGLDCWPDGLFQTRKRTSFDFCRTAAPVGRAGKLFIIRVLTVAALACFTQNAAAQKPIYINHPDFGCVGAPLGLNLPDTLSGLRSIGKLESEKVVHIDEWDGYNTIDKLLRFKGLDLHVVTFSNQPERYLLSLVEIKSPVWALAPFRVGQPSKAALGPLGVEHTAGQGLWRIYGESESVLIEVRHSKVSRVTYECYTG